MTDGLSLEDAYGVTLERIKAQGGQKSRLGMTALMWISHSERPLEPDELCQALAIEIGETTYNPDNVSSIRTVLSCCQGLVVVDKEGSTVRLIHLTLQEHLTNCAHLPQSPHSTIAETCLTYLQQVSIPSASYFPRTQETPFFEYSASYWGAHMKKEFSDLGKRLALKLLGHSKGGIPIIPPPTHLLHQYYFHHFGPRACGASAFTGLHYAAMFGLVEVASVLITMDGIGVNDMDRTGATPLMWAARSGHDGMAQLLLRRDRKSVV